MPRRPIPRAPITAKLVGERVKAAMDRANLCQADLVRAVGCYHPDISRLIAGRHMPVLPFLQRIADALGVRLKDLVDPD